MGTFIQELLNKVTRLPKSLVKGKENGRLPETMRAYLASKFKVLPENMADLRCVGRSDNFVRIFNAAKAREQGIIIEKYRDLDKHRELILYYGQIDDKGRGYLKREQHERFEHEV